MLGASKSRRVEASCSQPTGARFACFDRSSRLGLDAQALRAAAAWRFAPGTRLGKPVAVLVTIQLGFSIH